jgi:hypothetical protein
VDKLENNHLPPLTRDCPECGGSCEKIIPDLSIVADMVRTASKCPNCHGTGKVCNYLTPEQYVSWMRDHGHPDYVMIDDAPVWDLFYDWPNGYYWGCTTLKSPPMINKYWSDADQKIKYRSSGRVLNLGIFGQPAPPKDYRP